MSAQTALDHSHTCCCPHEHENDRLHVDSVHRHQQTVDNENYVTDRQLSKVEHGHGKYAFGFSLRIEPALLRLNTGVYTTPENTA